MRIAQLAARTIAVLIALLLAAPVVWQVASRDFFMVVEGRSMEPTYAVGDVLVVQKPRGDELSRLGEIVIMEFAAGEAAPSDQMYVHRVVEPLGGGQAWLQGDANAERDPVPVEQSRVLGTPRLELTGATAAVFSFSQSLVGRVVLAGAILLLLFVPGRARRRTSERRLENAPLLSQGTL